MNQTIADTGRWTALLRARESERSDALFKDPLALHLVGQVAADDHRGPPRDENLTWPIVVRTHLIDQLVSAEIARGSDVVLNLAAGLDTRPYRMNLPVSLLWMEVDLPQVMADKTEALKDAAPNCRVERIGLDLTDAMARSEFLQTLASRAGQVLILTEGFLVYLDESSAGSLINDFTGCQSVKRWIADLQLPGLLRLLRAMGPNMTSGGMELRFAPEDGPEFFARYGWRLLERRSIHEAAVQVGRIASPGRGPGRGERTFKTQLTREDYTGLHRWRVDGLACTFARP